MKIVLFVCSIFLITSCSNNPKTQDGNLKNDSNDFVEIDLEKSFNNEQAIGLSQIASSVNYIVLETGEDCMLRPVIRYYFTDSLIFIRNFDHILKFKHNGMFIQRIGASGRGPGEIDLIRNLSLIPEKKTLVVQKNYQRELLYFSFDGDLIKPLDYEPHIENFKVLPNGNFLTYESGANGTEDIIFCLMNEKWDTLSTVNNYSKWTSAPRNMQIMIGYPVFEPFYISQNRYHMKSMYNDTVYGINADKIIPEYFLNLGKYKLPDELRPERLGINQLQKFRDNNDRYYFIQVFETSENIFIAAHNYGNEELAKHLIYNKLNKECILLETNDYPQTGFINDWDGGMDFWPVGQINDNQVFMPITPLQLQKIISENSPKKFKIKFPEKRNEFLKLVSSVSETDNPILMVVTLKKE